MIRLLICLPVCFLFAPSSPESTTAARVPAFADTVADDVSNPLPSAAKMERLASDDPIAFLENCLRHYQRDVKGYTCTFQKQERIGDKVQRTEIIDVAFREEPYSVLFRWVEGRGWPRRASMSKGKTMACCWCGPKAGCGPGGGRRGHARSRRQRRQAVRPLHPQGVRSEKGCPPHAP